jgi:hypothetical protein
VVVPVTWLLMTGGAGTGAGSVVEACAEMLLYEDADKPSGVGEAGAEVGAANAEAARAKRPAA